MYANLSEISHLGVFVVALCVYVSFPGNIASPFCECPFLIMLCIVADMLQKSRYIMYECRYYMVYIM